jgi:hypothetical protein
MFWFKKKPKPARAKTAEEILFELKVYETNRTLQRDSEGIKELQDHAAIREAESRLLDKRPVWISRREMCALDASWAKARMPRLSEEGDPHGIMWWGTRIMVKPEEGTCDYPGCEKDSTEENMTSGVETCSQHHWAEKELK